ncbi:MULTISPECIES: hypothetical protein [unclassified Caballeronia]|uniref:hypothetical protein n=1 Tax=unclassified Caballeronia TaxID=2646786 RepID=UPI0028562250|nr:MULTISPECIES: hypothetical protein [unclassified Caballeronia]MDR5754735.1 hypothetical protein [Caballeronia sp. LZ024]MDR5839763.1 hypothetical protein [Caballeronia sp. LZ031]
MRHPPVEKRIDADFGSYILDARESSTSRTAFATCSASRHGSLKPQQSSEIVRVRSPLVIWSRSLYTGPSRAERSITCRCGSLFDRRFQSAFTILSRRSVRRHNSVAARAFIAVHCVGVSSLLP